MVERKIGRIVGEKWVLCGCLNKYIGLYKFLGEILSYIIFLIILAIGFKFGPLYFFTVKFDYIQSQPLDSIYI